MRRILGLLIFAGMAAAVISQWETSPDDQPVDTAVAQDQHSEPVATIDKSAEAQRKREDLIDELIERQIFYKVEVPGTLPRLYVRPAFYSLEIDMKESFVGVVYAYYFDGSSPADSVRIFDSRSGKEVGSLTRRGLTLD